MQCAKNIGRVVKYNNKEGQLGPKTYYCMDDFFCCPFLDILEGKFKCHKKKIFFWTLSHQKCYRISNLAQPHAKHQSTTYIGPKQSLKYDFYFMTFKFPT